MPPFYLYFTIEGNNYTQVHLSLDETKRRDYVPRNKNTNQEKINEF